MNARILVSTHDLERAGALRDAFRKEGYTVELVTPREELTTASTGEDNPRLLVLSDAALSSDALELIRQARERDIPVMGYRREGDDERSPEALDALEDVLAPRTRPDEAALLGRTLVERRRLQEVTGIVGETDAMREALERVVQIAPVAATVLVTGESGTGKELVARGLHALSPRRHKAFIAVNVAALSDTLLESELFGHEKGAFTGAVDARRGLFELAHGGTIFLDEIGEMPLATQTKLLRILEQREFLRVGGEDSIKVDVRVVTATNQELRQLVAIGDFRRDLYYRLNVLRIELPPLRERVEDIPRLVRAFVRDAAERHDRPEVEITPAAMKILETHHWPGNVRELRNLVESMVVLSPGREIRPEDIPPEIRSTSPGRSLVPATIPRPPSRGRKEGDDGGLRPELEFVFRTLVELRIDMDDLRREFEAYREEADSAPLVLSRKSGEPGSDEPTSGFGGQDVRVVEVAARDRPSEAGTDAPRAEGEGGNGLGDGGDAGRAAGREDDDVVVYRPGMTMEEMEREAIVAALREVGGNRRKAAEMLGIGERTLYRKINKFNLDEEDEKN